jgi:CBS domain-containing protein
MEWCPAGCSPNSIVDWRDGKPEVTAQAGTMAGRDGWEIMTAPVVSVLADTPVGEIAQTLRRHRISAVPVVDEASGVVGLVSEYDLLARAGRPGDHAVPALPKVDIGCPGHRRDALGRVVRHRGARRIASVRCVLGCCWSARSPGRSHIRADQPERQSEPPEPRPSVSSVSWRAAGPCTAGRWSHDRLGGWPGAGARHQEPAVAIMNPGTEAGYWWRPAAFEGLVPSRCRGTTSRWAHPAAPQGPVPSGLTPSSSPHTRARDTVA